MRAPVPRNSRGTQSAASRHGFRTGTRAHLCNRLEEPQHSRARAQIQRRELTSHQTQISSAFNRQRFMGKPNVERRILPPHRRCGNQQHHEKIRYRKPAKTLEFQKTRTKTSNPARLRRLNQRRLPLQRQVVHITFNSQLSSWILANSPKNPAKSTTCLNQKPAPRAGKK